MSFAVIGIQEHFQEYEVTFNFAESHLRQLEYKNAFKNLTVFSKLLLVTLAMYYTFSLQMLEGEVQYCLKFRTSVV